MTAPLFSRSPHPLGSSAEAPTPGESVARHPGDGGPKRVLDLFCGAGGAAMGYHLAWPDAEIVGVDNRPQPNYPFAFVQADALSYPLDGFDFVHASPPCQLFCSYRRHVEWRKPSLFDRDLDLIDATRARLHEWGGPYVIENVPGAPLHDPVTVCGSSFGLDIRRHRCFEASVPLRSSPCDHAWQTPRFPPAGNRMNLRSTVEVGVWRIPVETQRKAMGIEWMDLRELSQAIPPAYTRYLAEQFDAWRSSSAGALSTPERTPDTTTHRCADGAGLPHTSRMAGSEGEPSAERLQGGSHEAFHAPIPVDRILVAAPEPEGDQSVFPLDLLGIPGLCHEDIKPQTRQCVNHKLGGVAW